MIKATELLLQERIPRREIVIKEHDSIVYHRDLEEGRQHQEVQAKRTFTSPIPLFLKPIFCPTGAIVSCSPVKAEDTVNIWNRLLPDGGKINP